MANMLYMYIYRRDFNKNRRQHANSVGRQWIQVLALTSLLTTVVLNYIRTTSLAYLSLMSLSLH